MEAVSRPVPRWNMTAAEVEAILARDAKVAEIVAATREWARSTDPAPPISYIYADGFDDIAAQYPKEHQPMSKPTRITAELVAAEKAAAIKSGMTEQAAEELVTKLYASKHVTDGERCWCDDEGPALLEVVAEALAASYGSTTFATAGRLIEVLEDAGYRIRPIAELGR